MSGRNSYCRHRWSVLVPPFNLSIKLRCDKNDLMLKVNPTGSFTVLSSVALHAPRSQTNETSLRRYGNYTDLYSSRTQHNISILPL